MKLQSKSRQIKLTRALKHHPTTTEKKQEEPTCVDIDILSNRQRVDCVQSSGNFISFDNLATNGEMPSVVVLRSQPGNAHRSVLKTGS